MQRGVADLEQHTLLWIHRRSLGCTDQKNTIVEEFHASHEAAVAHLLREPICRSIPPAVGRLQSIDDSIGARGDGVPDPIN